MALTKRFTWCINASVFEEVKFGESVTSQKFTTIMNHISYTWCLKLYPKGCKINDSDNPNLYLSVVYLTGPEESVYTISSYLVGHPLSTIYFCLSLSKTGIECKINKELLSLYIPSEDIANFLSRPDTNGNRLLVFITNLTLERDLFMNLSFPDIPEPAVFHSNDLLLLRVLNGDDEKLSDFSIITGEHIFAANRCILATRSPYFEQFFIESGEDWIEKKVNQMSAPIGKKAMSEILTYIYTDRVNIPRNDDGMLDVELMKELIGGADYFRLSDLQKHYERPLYYHLIANQSSENALSFSILADRYRFKLLKNCALFILYDHWDRIEEHVSNVLGISAEAENKDDVEEEDEIVTMWKILQVNQSAGISLIDEIYDFIRQTSAILL